MTKEEVIRNRNILKCGKEVPTAEDKSKLGRPIKIFGENGVQVLDELSAFVMWDDEHETVFGIVRGNGINGGQIPQTAQGYSNLGWKTGIHGENFQLVAIPYVEIAAMCCAATMDHVQELLNYYKSTLSGAAAEAFQKSADAYMKYMVRPLHDIETYTESDIEDSPYPYDTPIWDDINEKWIRAAHTDPITGEKTEQQDYYDLKTNRFGEPFKNPDDYLSKNDKSSMM